MSNTNVIFYFYYILYTRKVFLCLVRNQFIFWILSPPPPPTINLCGFREVKGSPLAKIEWRKCSYRSTEKSRSAGRSALSRAGAGTYNLLHFSLTTRTLQYCSSQLTSCSCFTGDSCETRGNGHRANWDGGAARKVEPIHRVRILLRCVPCACDSSCRFVIVCHNNGRT